MIPVLHVVDRDQARDLITSMPDAFGSLVSIWEPEGSFASGKWVEDWDGRKQVMMFDDAEYEGHPWYRPPTWDQMRDLVTFLEGVDTERPALFHCAAGVSRSTAAATAYLAIHLPREQVYEIPKILMSSIRETTGRGWREHSGHAPNRRMVWMFDQILDFDGALFEAVRLNYYAGRTPYNPQVEVSPEGVEPVVEKPDWLIMLEEAEE